LNANSEKIINIARMRRPRQLKGVAMPGILSAPPPIRDKSPIPAPFTPRGHYRPAVTINRRPAWRSLPLLLSAVRCRSRLAPCSVTAVALGLVSPRGSVTAVVLGRAPPRLGDRYRLGPARHCAVTAVALEAVLAR
jgi:hypothetical protein